MSIAKRSQEKGRCPTGFSPVWFTTFGLEAMKSIGAGVREIRIRQRNDKFRVVYLAKFSELIYVLHVFQKKTRKTSRTDIDIARRRFKSIPAQRRSEE